MITTASYAPGRDAMFKFPRRTFPRPRVSLAVMVLFALGVCGPLNRLTAQDGVRSVRVNSREPLTSFEQIWALPDAEQNEWHRLRLEYDVYYYDPLWKAMWGRSGGVESYLSIGSKPFPIKVG